MYAVRTKRARQVQKDRQSDVTRLAGRNEKAGMLQTDLHTVWSGEEVRDKGRFIY